MNKKYFETKRGSLEEKITQIANEQPTIKKQEPQIKLEVNNTYFDTKPGSVADIASRVVSENYIVEKLTPSFFNTIGSSESGLEKAAERASDAGNHEVSDILMRIADIYADDPENAAPEAKAELARNKNRILQAIKNRSGDKKEAMDPVNKDAVKKKFDDRKDKDIDNDGDVDSSDKFLHKRRKAISKAMKEAVTPDDKGEKQNMSKVKAYTDPKKGEKEIIKPISENTPDEKIASLRTRQMTLQTKLRDLDPGNPKDKTKMAITKNDIENIQMKMDDLKKSASKQEKKTYSELRKETREIQLGDKGKTLTGKSAPKIDVEPRANPI